LTPFLTTLTSSSTCSLGTKSMKSSSSSMKPSPGNMWCFTINSSETLARRKCMIWRIKV
jgi:hypothetical protein